MEVDTPGEHLRAKPPMDNPFLIPDGFQSPRRYFSNYTFDVWLAEGAKSKLRRNADGGWIAARHITVVGGSPIVGCPKTSASRWRAEHKRSVQVSLKEFVNVHETRQVTGRDRYISD